MKAISNWFCLSINGYIVVLMIVRAKARCQKEIIYNAIILRSFLSADFNEFHQPDPQNKIRSLLTIELCL